MGRMRLRQVALVARELDSVLADWCAVLGIEVAFRDPGVREFGKRGGIRHAVGFTRMKPAETLWVSSLETNRWQKRKLCKLRRNEFCSFSTPVFCVVTSPAGDT